MDETNLERWASDDGGGAGRQGQSTVNRIVVFDYETSRPSQRGARRLLQCPTDQDSIHHHDLGRSHSVNGRSRPNGLPHPNTSNTPDTTVRTYVRWLVGWPVLWLWNSVFFSTSHSPKEI